MYVGLSVQFSRHVLNILFWHVITIFELLHDVEAIFHHP